VSKPTIEQLRERVRGQVIMAGDAQYEEARKVYNGMIDRRPRVVVRCVDSADVMATVDYSRENGLDLAVRGGSHSVPGFGTNDDGVVADLSRMKGVAPSRSSRLDVAVS
jgi:FAD/FMN-containing dehydrogenase